MARVMILLMVLAAAAAGCNSNSKEHDMSHASHIGHLRHVVFFKFKPDTTPQKIAEIEKAFAALPSRIPQIVDFEWGTNISPEGLDWGYTHCFVVTFADAAGRDVYLTHPAHQEFVALAGPHLDKPHVIDFVAKR